MRLRDLLYEAETQVVGIMENVDKGMFYSRNHQMLKAHDTFE
jgi:hypothetical protein